MTGGEEEGACAHGGPDQLEYYKPGDGGTLWLSNLCRSKLLHQTTGQCGVQILWNKIYNWTTSQNLIQVWIKLVFNLQTPKLTDPVTFVWGTGGKPRVGTRKKRGREVYGRWEKRGQEAGFPRKRKFFLQHCTIFWNCWFATIPERFKWQRPWQPCCMTGTIKLIRIILLMVIQHGGDDVSCKPRIEKSAERNHNWSGGNRENKAREVGSSDPPAPPPPVPPTPHPPPHTRVCNSTIFANKIIYSLFLRSVARMCLAAISNSFLRCATSCGQYRSRPNIPPTMFCEYVLTMSW